MNILHGCGVLVGRILRLGVRDEWDSFRRGVRIALVGVTVVGGSAAALVARSWDDMVGRIAPTPTNVPGGGAHRLVIRADDRNQCHVEATVNGQRFSMLMDSGADRLFFTTAQARQLGFDPGRLAYDHTYDQWGGTVRGANVVLREFRLGGFVARNVEAAIDSTDYGESLIGAPVLKLLHFQVVNGFCLVSW